jgi:RNA polymerase sigma factor (TIGR02999 family)
MSDTSRLLGEVAGAVPGAQERLFAHVYSALSAMARGKLANDGLQVDFNPSDVVNEAYLKLCGRGDAAWENRRHFYGAAARAMHQVLVDHARARKAVKRGRGRVVLGLDEDRIACGDGAKTDVLEIALALDELEATDPRAAKVVRLRIYAGMTLAEAAGELGISERTASNDWMFARAWLFERLKSTQE